MVLIKEFRILMPFTLDEYQAAQKYGVARMSAESTSSSEGVELLESKPIKYVDENDPDKKEVDGVYTHKIYHLGSYLPGWLRAIIPNSALKLEEKAWDSFPYCKTVLTHSLLGEKFEFTIESKHIQGELGKVDKVENIHNLRDKKLKKRKIENMDFVLDTFDKKYYKPEEDPTIFKSKIHERFGPLKKGWQKEAKILMCAYKVVTIRTKIFGLQTRLENWIMDFERDIFLRFHKQLYTWVDEWFGKNAEEIKKAEELMWKQASEKIAAVKQKEEKEPATVPPEIEEILKKSEEIGKNEEVAEEEEY